MLDLQRALTLLSIAYGSYFFCIWNIKLTNAGTIGDSFLAEQSGLVPTHSSIFGVLWMLFHKECEGRWVVPFQDSFKRDHSAFASEFLLPLCVWHNNHLCNSFPSTYCIVDRHICIQTAHCKA